MQKMPGKKNKIRRIEIKIIIKMSVILQLGSLVRFLCKLRCEMEEIPKLICLIRAAPGPMPGPLAGGSCEGGNFDKRFVSGGGGGVRWSTCH